MKEGREAASDGLTLEALAEYFALPQSELQNYGCRDVRVDGHPAVAIPYYDRDGALMLAVQRRLRLAKPAEGRDDRFRFRSGDKVHLYGLDQMARARDAGYALLVEGASDCWAAWHHGIPAVGVPGASSWRSAMAIPLAGLAVYVWQEPDSAGAGLVERVACDLPDIRVICASETAYKDIAEAHRAGIDVRELLEKLRSEAPTHAELAQQRRAAQLPELQEAAREVLGAVDPLELVRDALAATYGGDLNAPLLIYLAASSRLLALGLGSMPCHVLVIGPASIGKSYTASVALDLLPQQAKHTIEAGSPRVLIYDDAPLQHRLLCFSESDSLPAGEDNPAASAIRGLLQDNRLHYQVPVRDAVTGQFVVCDIDKPGPTAFLTTSTKRLGFQLDTRVLTVEVADDDRQIRAALTKQADLELGGQPLVPHKDALLAYQSYLQSLAPWKVVIPFVRELSDALGAQPSLEGRLMRDLAKLRSLIKAVTVLRQAHRQRDDDGRLLATLDDYAAVYRLVVDAYRATCGASEKVRQVVEAAETQLAERESVSQSDLRKLLGLSKSTVSGRVKAALRGGWLVNCETVPGRSARLKLGEPLPQEAGLPTPEALAEAIGRTGERCATSRERPQSANVQAECGDRSGVRAATDAMTGATPNASAISDDRNSDHAAALRLAARLVTARRDASLAFLAAQLDLYPAEVESLLDTLTVAGVVGCDTSGVRPVLAAPDDVDRLVEEYLQRSADQSEAVL